MKRLVTALFLIVATVSTAEPRAVAIRNARIVTVSGPAIAKGTVVVRNGVIDAVGENVAIPAGAFVVEGEGLTVYPGLIDALSTLGLGGASAAAAPTGASGRGGRGTQTTTVTTTVPATPAAPAAAATRSMGPEDRPQTTSWEMAADEISPSDSRIPNVRGAGVTTAVTFPTRGIFGGQGAIIDLITGEKPGEMVVVPAAGQYIAISRGSGFGGGMGAGFPSSLMGNIAYIRQIYLDAGHYQAAKEAYEKDPRGAARPAYDRALEGVLASKRILLPANRVVEIDRILRLAAELKQPTILYGLLEAYRPEAAELLKKSGTPVLLSLKWPELPREIDPDNEPTMRSLEAIDKAPSGAAALKKAGVRFALYSDGLEQPRDLQRAVKKAIDAGLSREDAIRALTLSPAEIYGVADKLGSIEKGKIGNLVVTRGDLFDDHTQVVWTIVEGRHYKPVETGPAGGRGAATEEPGGDR
jgi:imidazolonepropionase-like amidohydrolase